MKQTRTILLYCGAGTSNYGDALAIGMAAHALHERLGKDVNMVATVNEGDLTSPVHGLVFGPGSVFLMHSGFFRHGLDETHLFRSEIPFVIYGGLSSLDPAQHATQVRLLDRARAVVVRWNAERAILLETFPEVHGLSAKVHVGGDPGFWEIPPPRPHRGPSQVVTIAVASFLRGQPSPALYPGLVEGMRGLVDHLHAVGYEIVYLLGEPQDLTVVEKIEGQRTSCRVSWEARGVVRRRTLLSNSDYLIASRMHPLISAVPRVLPFVALNYDDKIRRMASDVGCEDYSLNIPDCTAGRLIERFEALVEGRDEIERRLRGAAERMRAVSLAGIDRVAEALRR